MSEEFELSIDANTIAGVSISEDVLNELWNLVESLIQDFHGKRLKTVEKTTDSVAAFFGGPSMGQSSWARECVLALNSLTGENIVHENESDLQALHRLFVDDEPRWMVGILEFLLQGWAETPKIRSTNGGTERRGISVQERENRISVWRNRLIARVALKNKLVKVVASRLLHPLCKEFHGVGGTSLA